MVNIPCSRASGQLIIVQSVEHKSHEYQMFKIGCSGDIHIRGGEHIIFNVSIRYDLQSIVKDIKKYLDRHFEARGSCYGETKYKISDAINRIRDLVSKIEPPKKHRTIPSYVKEGRVPKKDVDMGMILATAGALRIASVAIPCVGIAYGTYKAASWGYSYFTGNTTEKK